MKQFTLRFYLAPWRLMLLYAGTVLLCFGAEYYQLPDWDVGVSVLMALLTYLTAPWAVHVIHRGLWAQSILAIFLYLLTVDVSYMLYNGVQGRPALELENFIASTPLYWMMGVIWYFGAEVIASIRNNLKAHPSQ